VKERLYHENMIPHEHEHEHEHKHKHDHQSEVEVLSVLLKSESGKSVDVEPLEKLLSSAQREEVYRIKGIVRCSLQTPLGESSEDLESSRQKSEASGHRHYILNWAFGRWTCTPSTTVAENADDNSIARLTFILALYESSKWKKEA